MGGSREGGLANQENQCRTMLFHGQKHIPAETSRQSLACLMTVSSGLSDWTQLHALCVAHGICQVKGEHCDSIQTAKGRLNRETVSHVR